MGPSQVTTLRALGPDGVYALGVGSGGAGESDIPFCLSGVQGVAVQDVLAEAELTELSRSSRRSRGAWEELDKRAASTVLVISAAKLKDSRAHCGEYDLTMDQIALDAIKSRFAEPT